MTDIVPLPGSAGVKDPMLNLFRVPPTDLSILSYRMVPIHPFTTGINPIDFQIDPQEDYIDLSRSYFELRTGMQHCTLPLQTDQRATQWYAHQSSD